LGRTGAVSTITATTATAAATVSTAIAATAASTEETSEAAAGHRLALLGLHFLDERLKNGPFLVSGLELLLDSSVHAVAEFLNVEAAAISAASAALARCILSERHDSGGGERERGQEEFGCHFHCCRLLFH
jgi:hypothetical protein